MNFSPADDPSGSWHSFTTRAAETQGLPSIAYSLSPDGLSLTGQQYATSLLNLLHSDRGEMGPSMASSSKPELHPSWTVPQGFRDSVDPNLGFEPGGPSTAKCHPKNVPKSYSSIEEWITLNLCILIKEQIVDNYIY